MTSEFKVLARKYRPDNLSDVRGQDLLVRALSNAIKSDRLAHAFLLSGIRGIGKTTSARIIAKTINCENVQYQDGTAMPCNQCKNCKAFTEEKHPDVLEIDAASKTGVNDVREIIEGTVYKPIMAKYKVYIIDEVHMLSTSAFNALLKTLEEPPAHVKFIFATTEMRKIPMTIMSRCQKFELRRLTESEMEGHLQAICEKEEVSIEPQGLLEIAKLSEGSVRDALSLMDLIINSAEKGQVITYEMVKSALGIVNKEEITKLLKSIISAQIPNLLGQFKGLFFSGAKPSYIIEELLLIINDFTKFKLTGEKNILSSQDNMYVNFIAEYCAKIDHPRLLYLWQSLFKGLREIAIAPSQYAFTEMLLIKSCFIAGSTQDQKLNHTEVLSYPIRDIEEKMVKSIESGESEKAIDKGEEIYQKEELGNLSDQGQIERFKNFVEQFRKNQELIIAHHLSCDVYLVSITDSELVFRQKKGVPHNLANQVAKLAKDFTGTEWRVRIVANGGDSTLEDLQGAVAEVGAQDEVSDKVTNNELVQNVLDSFAGSKITKINCVDETVR